MRNVVRYVAILGIVCVLMGFGIGLSYQVMKERIDRKELEVTLSALDEVLPPDTKRSTLTGVALDDPSVPFKAIFDAMTDADAVFVATADGGAVAGYAAVAEQQGYSSKVRVVVGIGPDVGDLDAVKVKGVRVVSQQETPGLGTNIEERRSSKSLWDVITLSKKPEVLTRPFLDRFEGATYGQLEIIKTPDETGRIQAVTAATISSTAVTDATRKAVEKIRNAVLKRNASVDRRRPPSDDGEG